ncbi:hypothetical protein EW145_g7433 [Phellinidium pouzarii]|uniref:Uncharacterized protein n=1 Tax=Phellinidium pouzarii TaxID=167371 RepID=A0A4S4KKB4_9AGAM|nr:hypothetical protein EW145_g7433 [Phellinidium pouzarii]
MDQDHLSKDWKFCHESECTPDVKPIISQMPRTVRAILFEPEEVDLQFTSVKYQPSTETDPFPRPDIRSYFKTPQRDTVLTNLKRLDGKCLGHLLHVFFGQLELNMPVNRAIENFTGKADLKPWYGSVIVLRFKDNCRDYEDVKNSDVKALLAYFLTFKRSH